MSGEFPTFPIANALMGEEYRKRAAWNRAYIILGRDENLWRRDELGNTIYWHDYGDRSSDFGWELDHRQPSALGGTNALANIRALHWRSNASLGGLLGNALARR